MMTDVVWKCIRDVWRSVSARGKVLDTMLLLMLH
jgi:hypothetical protein